MAEGTIDTGAIISCMSEDQMHATPHYVSSRPVMGTLKGATGVSLEPVMAVTYHIGIEGQYFIHEFVVCKNLVKPLLIGLDFIAKHCIGIAWHGPYQMTLQLPEGENINCVLKAHEQQVFPNKTINVPPRNLAVITVRAEPMPIHQMVYALFRPSEWMKQYPYLSIQEVAVELSEEAPLTFCIPVINHSHERFVLSSRYSIGDLSIITDEVYTVRDVEENVNVVHTEENEESRSRSSSKSGRRFIISPADVRLTRKTDLQDATVTEEIKTQFSQLCSEYETIFSKGPGDLGCTPLIKMDIETGDNPPISQRPYNLPLKHVDWVAQEIQTLEEAGIIERSVSPWASPIVIVPKKAAPGQPPKKRMCVDYRALNKALPKVTKAFSKAKGILTLVPIPKVDEIYAKLQGSQIYSAVDVRSGYYHIELTEDAKPKSAFVISGPHGGKWQFKRVPFGLTQAPAYFQQLVNEVLHGLPFAFGYIDDILIFSATPEQHIDHLRAVFERFRRADLKLSWDKCSFLKRHVQYLGHLISGQGIEPVKEKLSALQEMVEPRTVTEVRKFLGFVGYYRKFIPRFADIARALTNLTKKDNEFVWTKACQVSFEYLKELLLKEPILRYPDPAKPYILFTDASKYAWAGVLTQEYQDPTVNKHKMITHPIAYVSGMMHGPQLGWAALVKEAYAIYMSCRKLQYYLQDSEIILKSDHLPLKNFLIRNTCNAKVNNWAVELSQLKIEFQHVKGIKNTLADTLSRLVKMDPDIKLDIEDLDRTFGETAFEVCSNVHIHAVDLEEGTENTELQVSIVPSISSLDEAIPADPSVRWNVSIEELKKIQNEDKFCANVVNRLRNGKLPVGEPYYMEDEILHRHVHDYKQRFDVIVIPRDMASIILNLAHDQLGHNGSARTYMIVKRHYYWKGIKADCTRYVKSCDVCREHNIVAARYIKGHFEIPKAPMDFISMDLIGPFQNTPSGNQYALTVICMLTGFVMSEPIPDKTPGEVINAYFNRVYTMFGGSRKIISDNGSEFKNKLFTLVAKAIGVEYKNYSPPYHPQSNGRIEGFHAFLKACLAKHLSPQYPWDKLLYRCCAAYNFLPNEHSRESPFFLMFWRDPRLPLSELMKPQIRYLGNDQTLIDLEAMNTCIYFAACNLQKAREHIKQNTKGLQHIEPHDLVYLKNHVRTPFEPRYVGEFRVVTIKGNTVHIQPKEGGPVRTAHISHLKKILPVDAVIQHLPHPDQFGRKAKLAFHPDDVPDLHWQITDDLHVNWT